MLPFLMLIHIHTSIAQLQRSATLNALSPTLNGITIAYNPKTTNTFGSYYNISVKSQHTYDIAISLAPKWSFKSTTNTTLIFTLNGATPNPTADADFMIIFTANNTQFFSFFVHLDLTTTRSHIYPLAKLATKPNITAWLADSVTFPQRWDRISEGNQWVVTKPRYDTAAQWPLQFQIENNIVLNSCIFSYYDEATIYKTGNTFNDSFRPNTPLTIYIMGDTSKEQYQIYDINIQLYHVNGVPTIPPTLAPTQKPTTFPTLNPSISPSQNPTYNPLKTPSVSPTNFPSQLPTVSPLDSPSKTPSDSDAPSINPVVNVSPSTAYTQSFTPTMEPTLYPTKSPSQISFAPAITPTHTPSIPPSLHPSAPVSPSDTPSITPIFTSLNPTYIPTFAPTASPTYNPTNEPIIQTTQSHTHISTQITSTSPYLPTDARCSANYAFVNIELPSTLSQTVMSERVNFPPFGYQIPISDKTIVLFANGENITDITNNPCNVLTWNTSSTYYNDTIVLITYSNYFETLCSAQRWTLNLEQYANVCAVLIGNDNDLHGVYALSGDSSMADPTIPTRMISKSDASFIIDITSNEAQNVFATIDCFNNTLHPAIICIVDHSPKTTPNLIFIFDGEFQEQAHLIVNHHPVWYKKGHSGPHFHNDYYIWLAVNHSVTNEHNPWRWVIGTDYNNDTTISMQCILNSTQYTEYSDDPTLCGNNWYMKEVSNGTLTRQNVSSHGGICNIGDIFVCVKTSYGSPLAGRYRQYHKSIAYWISETSPDTFITPTHNLFGRNELFFAMGQGTNTYSFAVCATGFVTNDTTAIPNEMLFAPWDCISWYLGCWTIGCFPSDIDVDECTHPNVTNNISIYYPPILCLHDSFDQNENGSFLQGYYGLYLLDNTTEYDGRYIFKNQRPNGNISWYIVFVDELDRWVITAQTAPPFTIYAYCAENVATADLCGDCWRFRNVFLLHFETECNVSVIAINSRNESDCIGNVPTNNIIQYTNEITACFSYGELTGKYTLQQNIAFNGRAVWLRTEYYNLTKTEVTWYVYYSERWKYWIIGNVIQQQLFDDTSWDYVCLLWKEYEPWNCTKWYDMAGNSIDMHTDCTLPPTFQDTNNATAMNPTQNPTTLSTQTAETTQIAQINRTELQDSSDNAISGDGAGSNSKTIAVVVVIFGVLFLFMIVFGAVVVYKRFKSKKVQIQDGNGNEEISMGKIIEKDQPKKVDMNENDLNYQGMNDKENGLNNQIITSGEIVDDQNKKKDEIYTFRNGDTFSM